uniref:Uncharacterized protein n=1 Tax=Leersia perrieri TaxID=77586 RepID=A0A0D9WFU0_9ORYZ
MDASLSLSREKFQYGEEVRGAPLSGLTSTPAAELFGGDSETDAADGPVDGVRCVFPAAKLWPAFIA